MNEKVDRDGRHRPEAEARGDNVDVAQLRVEGLAVVFEFRGTGKPRLIRLQAALPEFRVPAAAGVAAAERIARADIHREARIAVGVADIDCATRKRPRLLIPAAQISELDPVVQLFGWRAVGAYPHEPRLTFQPGTVPADDRVAGQFEVLDPAILRVHHRRIDP